MCEVPVFYASTEGQTRRIAERIAQRLCDRGLASEAVDLSGPEARAVDWQGVRGAVVGASLHLGRHQDAATRFVTAQAARLNAVPSAFFSVSMAAASTHPQEVEQARSIAAAFLTATGWHPATMACFAGRLAYTQYGFVTRHVMRWIAWREGGSTDASRDWEYTDWHAVDRFAEALADQLLAAPARRAG